MKYATIICAVVLTSACLQQPTTECFGSSECDPGHACRAGVCVPVTPVNRDDSGSVPDVLDSTADQPRHDATDLEQSMSDVSDTPPAPCPGARQPEPGDLRINEVLANPPAGELGDANRDGTRDAFEDEFVEVVNITSEQLDLTRTALLVGDTEKARYSDLCLPPGEGVVVFGGFRGEGLPIVARGSTPLVAQSRLGLSNSGATLSLARDDGTTLDSVDYTDAPAESLTRAPQLRGGGFVEHSVLPGARLMSPGACADGNLLMTGCPDSDVPAPDASGGNADAGNDGGS